MKDKNYFFKLFITYMKTGLYIMFVSVMFLLAVIAVVKAISNLF